jgi:hypothetical protein
MFYGLIRIPGVFVIGLSLSFSTSFLKAQGPVLPVERVTSALQSPADLSTWKVDDDDPENSVPTPAQRDRDPLQFGYHLMDLADKADQATKKKDHRVAAKYWAAVVKAVPDRSTGFSKLCGSYEALGERAKALDTCRAALGRTGVTVADVANFVRLMLAKPTDLDQVDIEEVSRIVEGLKRNPATAVAGNELQCEIGVRLEDVPRLEECTRDLESVAPDDPKTLTYQWALAIKRGDLEKARNWVGRAKRTAMAEAGILRMEQATLDAERPWRRTRRHWRVLLGTSVLLGGIVLMLFKWRGFTWPKRSSGDRRK